MKGAFNGTYVDYQGVVTAMVVDTHPISDCWGMGDAGYAGAGTNWHW